MSLRVVSLVPSLTLTLFDLGLDATSVVGRTPWCIHPKGEVEQVRIVGGTKTPKQKRIEEAKPDLVVMDRDENPKAIYDWCLSMGYDTFVCDVRRPADVPDMLRALGRKIDRKDRAEHFALAIERALTTLPSGQHRTALPLIWHKPLMAADGSTYAGNMLACAGFEVPVIEPDGTGYPELSLADIVERGVTDLFLSSEPHEFTVEEKNQLHEALSKLTSTPPRFHFIDGEDLTWMGTHTAVAVERLLAAHGP